MKQIITPKSVLSSPYQGYEHAWNHIADELALLDLHIQLHIAYKKAAETDSAMEHLKGLVLFEEEIQQLLLNAEVDIDPADRIELQSEIAKLEQRIADKVKQGIEANVHLPLPYLVETYHLSRFEKGLLVLALAYELHRKYEKIFAYLQDDVTYKRPTIDLAMKLTNLTAEERMSAIQAVSRQSSFNKYFLEQDEERSSSSFMSRPFRLAERVVHYLLGSSQSDHLITSFAEVVEPTVERSALDTATELQDQMETFLSARNKAQGNRSVCIFNIWGQTGSGKKLQAKRYAQANRKNLLLVDVRKMLDEPVPFETLMYSTIREGFFQEAILCFYHADFLFKESDHHSDSNDREMKRRHFVSTLKEWNGVVFILSASPVKSTQLIKDFVYIDIHIPTPQDFQRKRIWEELTKDYTFDQPVNWGSVASKFRFTHGQIQRAWHNAQVLSAWQGGSSTAHNLIQLSALHQACYRQVEHHLEKKAVRIHPKYTWNDLILPAEQKEELRNACNQMKYRHIVYGEWGFDQKLSYGKGLSLLFSGPPGTGKTMSAQIMAQELELQIYKIDLSQVISKYIGETEKNLQEIFAEAQFSHAILFFDEADALFGKRSEVKDAHDKYANVETSYLLQKMEEYEGISILASNYLQNIDEAFLRRITYVIKYPFPDQAHREQIWRSLFPSNAPLSDDLDFGFLAEKLELSGGQIKNVAVSAAFLAAESGESIRMAHIIKAARHEIQKSGKIFLKEDLGAYDFD